VPEEKQTAETETPPEPESVQAVRNTLKRIEGLLDAGEVESISVYVERRDGCYQNFQTQTDVGRHEDAGRLLELTLLRLGFRLPEAEDPTSKQ
jgi:hypothetical protein